MQETLSYNLGFFHFNVNLIINLTVTPLFLVRTLGSVTAKRRHQGRGMLGKHSLKFHLTQPRPISSSNGTGASYFCNQITATEALIGFRQSTIHAAVAEAHLPFPSVASSGAATALGEHHVGEAADRAAAGRGVAAGRQGRESHTDTHTRTRRLSDSLQSRMTEHQSTVTPASS